MGATAGSHLPAGRAVHWGQSHGAGSHRTTGLYTEPQVGRAHSRSPRCTATFPGAPSLLCPAKELLFTNLSPPMEALRTLHPQSTSQSLTRTLYIPLPLAAPYQCCLASTQQESRRAMHTSLTKRPLAASLQPDGAAQRLCVCGLLWAASRLKEQSVRSPRAGLGEAWAAFKPQHPTACPAARTFTHPHTQPCAGWVCIAIRVHSCACSCKRCARL